MYNPTTSDSTTGILVGRFYRHYTTNIRRKPPPILSYTGR
jgi:hypothetical protein